MYLTSFMPSKSASWVQSIALLRRAVAVSVSTKYYDEGGGIRKEAVRPGLSRDSMRARQESNLRPADSKSDALSS